MKIRDMFVDDIDRKINGVIQVEQEDKTTEQEINEYVITKELRRHFIDFFTNYDDAFTTPTNDIGVWISGFFGSGKSHFLKMLSYILENKEINGVKTVERFRKKFNDDPGTFMLIDQATKKKAETILFNIDVEGFSNKDNTAVLKVFAKMFYNHLGFYGEDLKVAKLEHFIDKQGKTDEFRRVFKEINGESWVETRESFGFFEDDVVETLEKVLKMSETAARNWFNGTETAEITIHKLVSEIKDYVDSKKDDRFRLLFMVDEVGQYIGTDTNLLLNLQSLVEEVGSKCGGKVWIVCTGQEAIDEIIKVRMDEFSRIQARFKTRLSLSSSAVDEVIQKRLLSKTNEAKTILKDLYERNDYVLKNLFTFTDSVLDIKGYSGTEDFVKNYPFVPYQFTLIQKIFSGIRKHGAAGKHYSGAERSMLDGFQFVAKSIENQNENAIAPLYPFYDSIHTFLDGAIRRVIERCERAADNHDGIESYDVNVLKLLYLVRYIDDVKSNIDNIVILMAESINTDKIELKKKVQESLNRLKSQNYIDRRGNTYVFLTDEEQDIARDIANTTVDTAEVEKRIGDILFDDIYTTKKYHYGKNDFSFTEKVDSMVIGKTNGNMTLQFLTVATDESERQAMHLIPESKGSAIIVLDEASEYFELIENAAKIRKYVKQQNVNQKPESVQSIIRGQQDQANKYESDAKEELEKAIDHGNFYVDGDELSNMKGTPLSKIDQALKYLVEHVYYKLSLITENVKDDQRVIEILHGNNIGAEGLETNNEAAADIEDFLQTQSNRRMPTSMEDIQSKYQNAPYGWREIDIAAVVALLIYKQKVIIKVSGETIYSDNNKLPDMLRKKSERSKTMISIKQSPSARKMKQVKNFTKEYFGIMNIPDDEEGFVQWIEDHFKEKKSKYAEMLHEYENHHYPGKDATNYAYKLLSEVLNQSGDNIALIDFLLKHEDDLYDSKEDMENVESFFKTQRTIFDEAVNLMDDFHDDISYMKNDQETLNALSQIDEITRFKGDGANLSKRIPNLNGLMNQVRAGHNKLLEEKRRQIIDILNQCDIQIKKEADDSTQDILADAKQYYDRMKESIQTSKKIIVLEKISLQITNYKDNILEKINKIKNPIEIPEEKEDEPEKNVQSYNRQVIFSRAVIESEEDIDHYVERVRTYLTELLKECDEIKIN